LFFEKKYYININANTHITDLNSNLLNSSVKYTFNSELGKVKSTKEEIVYELYDDAYYKTGFKDNYDRNDTAGIVFDNNTKLSWQDNTVVAKSWFDASNYCSGLILGMYSDWRLPSVYDYDTITATANGSIALSSFFHVTDSYDYWTSSVVPEDTSKAWDIESNGYIVSASLSSVKDVRCVRGTESVLGEMTRKSTSIVFDKKTKLEWQDNESVVKNWSDSLLYCSQLSLAEKYDWRLPNSLELRSIVDYNNINSRHAEIFMNKVDSIYWTSTSYDTGTARGILFGGSLTTGSKSKLFTIRCVRGGL
jgi:hypothetical protein